MDNLQSLGQSTSASLSVGNVLSFSPSVNIQQIENGFLASWYDYRQGRQFSFHCADFDVVKSKLQDIFGK